MSTTRRFQIHLSTALVLMFAAGGLLWANMRPVHREDRIEKAGPVGDPKTGIRPPRPPEGWGYMRQLYVAQGWPVAYQRTYGQPGYESSQWNSAALVVDAAFAAVVLVLVTVASEWFIRRRKTPRP